MASSATASLFSHRGVRWVTLGWVGFITENLVLSHNREYLITNFGDDEYHMVYNVLSTAACGSIGYGLLKYGKLGPVLAHRRGSPLLQAAGFAVQALGLAGLSQLAPAFQIPIWFGSSPAPASAQSGQVAAPSSSSSSKGERKLYVRCPIDFKAKNPNPGVTYYGMDRVSRHPALWCLGLTAAGGAMATVYPTYMAALSFPLLFAWIGSEHTDYRYRRGNGGILTEEMEKETSNIPFAALFSGKQPWEKFGEEMKWTNAAIATAAAAMFAVRRMR